MTNLIASLILTTNVHWTTIESHSLKYECLIPNCTKDHTEQRIQRKDVYIITSAKIIFEGRETNIVLKSELKLGKSESRVQLSGIDYEKCPTYYPQGNWSTNTWPNIKGWTNWNIKIYDQ